MFDIGLSKMALVGVVALIVIGPEKLPRVARTAGTLLGRAQRYLSEVKAEVNKAMDVDELRRMKDTVQQAGQEIERSMRQTGASFQREVDNVGATLSGAANGAGSGDDDGVIAFQTSVEPAPPQYRNPGKKWRVKRGATPQWYKTHAGVRRHILSASARVARYRPKRMPGA